jgi:DNA (cytosine-5)-methyltransferase 1
MRDESHLSGRAGAFLLSGSTDSLAGRAEAHGREDVCCLTAGVPCQDVSVAGKRAGLAGERTGLFYEFARVLRELRPRWFIFENVPGLLSSNRGRDFAEVLRVLMVECGYGLSWRVLDSQYFGVAQRRRRLFIVGCFGKPCPAEILFEPESRSGNPAPCSEERSRIAATLTSGSGVTGNAPGRRREDDENLAYCLREDPRGIGQGHNTTYAVTENMRNRSQGPGNYVAATINSRHTPKGHGAAGARVEDIPNLIARPITQSSFKRHDEDTDTLVAATINSGGNSGGFRSEPGEHLAIAENQRGELRTSRVSPQLSCSGGKPGSGYPAALCSPPDADGVRDFAGLPEGLDSARYRALGNAVTVQVIEWIGRRIVEAEWK